MKITLFYPHVKFDQYGPCVSISFDCYIVINKLYNYTQRLAPCEFVRKDNIQGNFFLYSLSSFFLLSSFSSLSTELLMNGRRLSLSLEEIEMVILSYLGIFCLVTSFVKLILSFVEIIYISTLKSKDFN